MAWLLAETLSGQTITVGQLLAFFGGASALVVAFAAGILRNAMKMNSHEHRLTHLEIEIDKRERRIADDLGEVKTTLQEVLSSVQEIREKVAGMGFGGERRAK